MLHEILLSLSGHRSPLLQAEGSGGPTAAAAAAAAAADVLTPSEKALLGDLARLADLHVRLRARAGRIAAAHPSIVCRAVAAAVASVHLAAFQRDVLAVERTVLRRDPALVGAYDVVPLTAVVGAFAAWPRRFEWLWAVVQYILPGGDDGGGGDDRRGGGGAPVTAAQLIDHLRGELQTGYEDVEQTARSLVRVAETAWLKQVSAWILYGRLPTLGGPDFFVQRAPSTADTTGEYMCVRALLPAFVTPATAASMLFVGRSLVHLRLGAGGSAEADGGTKSATGGGGGAVAAASAAAAAADYHLSSQLQELAKLTYPLDGATFARTVAHIRAVLSRTALRTLLPPAKVVDMLQLLRDFYLLGRGEFAMALVEQADATMRSRWQRADGAGGGGGGGGGGGRSAGRARLPPPPPTTASGVRGMSAVLVKDGEVAAVLARTWAMLGAMQGRHANDDQGEDEDEGLELARETLRLVLDKPAAAAAAATTASATPATPATATTAPIAPTPFRNLLFSVPASLTLQIPYPLDLVLSAADLQAYAAVHAYLLSIRRAHIRLTGLWTLSSLRRHHPPPPAPPYRAGSGSGGGGGGGRARHSIDEVRMLRARTTRRADALRSVWATTSAAIFFLGEIEGYLQMEVVAELWDGFQRWLTVGRDVRASQGGGAGASTGGDGHAAAAAAADDDDDDGNSDIWLAEGLGGGADEQGAAARPAADDPLAGPLHDPQSLATAHRRYLRRLVRRLLLHRRAWTEPLYALLVAVDQLAALVHRLQALWAALDLEADAGVVDAFVDLDREQADVLDALAAAERGVRRGVLSVVGVLRDLEADEADEDDDEEEEEEGEEEEQGLHEGQEDPAGLGLRAAGAYVPRRVGRLDRLLMKLDFGSWGA